MNFQRFSQSEFDQYLPGAIEHLGNEVSKARDLTKEQGNELAKTSFRNLFPNLKVESEDQYVGYLVEDGTKIGVMHFGVRRDHRNPYIYLWDIEVSSDHRGKGYGKTAMLLLEEETKSLGIGKISLNVFGHNIAARSLYEKLGYQPASITMSKKLSVPR